MVAAIGASKGKWVQVMKFGILNVASSVQMWSVPNKYKQFDIFSSLYVSS